MSILIVRVKAIAGRLQQAARYLTTHSFLAKTHVVRWKTKGNSTQVAKVAGEM